MVETMSADLEDSSMIEGEDPYPAVDLEDWPLFEDSSKFEDVIYLSPVDDSVEYLSDVEEYADIKTFFYRGPFIYLHWNLEHFPIPPNADLDSIFTNIKLALHKLGIHGPPEIYLYGGDRPNDAKRHLYASQFIFEPPQGCGISTSGQMSRDIMFTATWEHTEPWEHTDQLPTFVVLAKQIPQSKELHRVLQCVQSRSHYVLKIEPTDGLFDTVDLVLKCTLFLDGQKTRGKTRPRKSSISAIEPITEPKAGVFWDAEDCPFPAGHSPDMIYKKINSALYKRGVFGDMSIFAYLDEKEETWGDKKTWDSRIDFYREGDKPARLERMYNDILSWKTHHPLGFRTLTDVIVFADNVRDDKKFFFMLELIQSRGYNVCLVTPAEGTGPESSEWPGSLLDGQVHVFGCKTESSQPKKHKAG